MTDQARPPAESRGWQSAIGAVAAALASGRLGAGVVAELRRLDPDDPGAPAFWHVLTHLVEPRDPGPAAGERARAAWERRWAVVLAGLARLPHRPGRAFGRALADAGFHELRLRRLLRAEGRRLSDEVALASRFLAAKGEGVDWTDASELIFSDGARSGDWSHRVRRRIARDYYASL